jgi:hypothetical protein
VPYGTPSTPATGSVDFGTIQFGPAAEIDQDHNWASMFTVQFRSNANTPHTVTEQMAIVEAFIAKIQADPDYKFDSISPATVRDETYASWEDEPAE